MFSALCKIGLLLLLLTDCGQSTPTTCFSQPTLVALVQCFETYTVLKGSYTDASYDSAQPTDTQRAEWRIVVQRLLSINRKNCNTLSIPPSLVDIYAIRSFQGYCVLYETTESIDGKYNKGWGFMVVRSKYHVTRHLHISAPHPLYDSGTVAQAAAIFEKTGSNSLLVAGRHRGASSRLSDCIPHYSITDPAHNTAEPFFDAFVVIHDWQHELDGCPSASCGFIQLHGKGATTCQSDTVFLSAGLVRSDESLDWYRHKDDLSVRRINGRLHDTFHDWVVSLPTDSDCNLIAAGNVGGRYINRVPIAKVCEVDAAVSTATGKFVHIEQASKARSASNFDGWSQALIESFA